MRAPLIAATLAVAAAACGGSSPARAEAGTRAPASSAYARTLVRDLTGDGRADSAVLVATGARPDSLDIALTLYVDGRAVHHEGWNSAYELIDVEESVRVRPRLDAHIRDRLDAAIESLQLAPIDTAEMRIMAERPDDVLAMLRPLPDSQLYISYGYETSVALAWDATGRRFVVLWSCC